MGGGCITSALPFAQAALVLDSAEFVEFTNGESLLSMGQEALYVMIVLSGSLLLNELNLEVTAPPP